MGFPGKMCLAPSLEELEVNEDGKGCHTMFGPACRAADAHFNGMIIAYEKGKFWSTLWFFLKGGAADGQ
jgi:hypothetical protein